MLTQNWYNALGIQTLRDTISATDGDLSGIIYNPWGYDSKNYAGQHPGQIGLGALMTNPLSNFNHNANNPLTGVVFGDGNKPPTIDDKELSGNLISNFVCSVLSSQQVIISTQDEFKKPAGINRTVKYILTNKNDFDISISEIGIVGTVQLQATGGILPYSILLERTILDNPVVIKPGETGAVEYTITMPFITN